VQGKDAQAAKYSAEAIDFNKWTEMDFDWKIVDVSRDYFLQRVKVDNNSNEEKYEND
jgi:predicted HNH restriction endonuclease